MPRQTMTTLVGDPTQPPSLTEEQELAVQRREGSLLLAAGAGSGKTSVLVERYVRAVTEDGVAPGEILAITFTERAAWELKERIRRRLIESGRRDLARDVEAAAIGTFHSFCARLLRSDPLAARLPPRLQILDEGLAQRMRLRAFSEALREAMAQDGEVAVDLAAAYGVDRLRRMVCGAYDGLRSAGQARPRLPLAAASSTGADADSTGADPAAAASARPDPAAVAATLQLLDSLLSRFGAAYERGKRSRGVLDFDDLELLALSLLSERDDVRQRWAERLRMLMVDELQDTNQRQLALLHAIERDNLFTVGDAWQSIYGFRNADVEIFRDRQAQLGASGSSLALTANFRSRPAIIDVVNSLFQERFGELYTPLSAARPAGGPAGVGSAAGAGSPAGSGSAAGAGSPAGSGSSAGARSSAAPAVEMLLTDRDGWDLHEPVAVTIADGLPVAPAWRQAEARLLAQRIAELVAEGRATPGDVAVLLRATGDLPVYERALAAAGLPTLATVGAFWDGPDVGDLLAYLSALANPYDELSLYGTLRSPLAGLSLDSLALLAETARSGERSAPLWDVLRAASLFDLPDGDGERASLPDLLDGDGERASLPDLLDGDGERAPLPDLPHGDGERLVAFLRRFAEQRRRIADSTLAQLLRCALSDGGFEHAIRGAGEGETAIRQRLGNVRKLVRLAADFEHSEGRDLRGFLSHVSLLRDSAADSEPEAPAGDADVDAVRLMSIHAAKGLEFKVVCVADLGRAPNRGDVPDLIVRGERVGLRLLSVSDPEPVSVLEYDELRHEREQGAAEEEDRILYVGMTRAEDMLLLSGAASFARWPEDRGGCPSIVWLAPALVADLPQRLTNALEAPVAADSVESGVRLLLSTAAAIGEVLRLPASAMPPPFGPPNSVPARTGPPNSVSARTGPTNSVPAPTGPTSAAEAFVEPPAAVELESVSYTTLAELERCGYRHYLERVLRLSEVELRSSPPVAQSATARRRRADARTLGEVAHRLLERLDFARPQPPSSEQVRSVAAQLGVELDQADADAVSARLAALSSTAVGERIAAAREVRTELPFTFSIGDDQPTISGAIDLLAIESDGTRLVVDYKSGAVTGDEHLERLVAERFGAQRLIYAVAALRDGAPAVEVVHWFVDRPQSPVCVRYDDSEAERLEGELRRRVRAVRERGYAVSERPRRALCLTCPGRVSRLCSWDEERMLSEG